MNLILWILQILLAAYNLIGGAYLIFNYENLKSTWAANLSPSAWIILGILQILFSLGLVLPGAFKMAPKYTAISAACLAVNSLLGCALFSAYSGFPGILWGAIPAILESFVAFRRTNK